MKKLSRITATTATKEQRRAEVSSLLARRISYGEVKKMLAAKYGVSQAAIGKDIEAAAGQSRARCRELQGGDPPDPPQPRR